MTSELSYIVSATDGSAEVVIFVFIDTSGMNTVIDIAQGSMLYSEFEIACDRSNTDAFPKAAVNFAVPPR